VYMQKFEHESYRCYRARSISRSYRFGKAVSSITRDLNIFTVIFAFFNYIYLFFLYVHLLYF